MRIIGITGPSGSGKTYLTEYLRNEGFPTIDADRVYHSLLTPQSECLCAIADAFGSSVIDEDGNLDRRALSDIVFNSEEKLELLNKTVLDIVIREIRKMLSALEAQGVKTVIVDAPTLIESGFHKECTAVISVIADRKLRISRIAERDGISLEKASKRIAAQRSDSFYEKNSDLVLRNNGDPRELVRRLKDAALL